MNDMFDQDTGEIKGEEISAPAHLAPQQASVPLLQAIEAIVKDLPIWITQDAAAKIADNRKQKYATLKAVLSVVRPIALKHGIRIRQGCEHAWQLDTGQIKGRMVPVFTRLIQSSTGDYEQTTVEIPISKMDAQAMGSAISYGRRYGLLLALGLTTDEASADDDGEGTKPRDLSESGIEEESQILWEIRAEIRECETIEALGKARDKIKSKGTLEKLTDAEMALARVAFIDQRKKLEKANDAEVKKGK